MADCRQIALPYIEDHSENVAQMRVQTNPGIPDSESLPADLAQELERLRYAVARHAGVPYWYSAPSALFSVQSPDYGAVGDGVVDDTAAILAAAAAANTARGILYLPPTQNGYSVTDLDLSAYTSIQGIVGDGINSKLVARAGTTTVLTWQNISGRMLRNFRVDCNNIATTGIDTDWTGGAGPSLRNIYEFVWVEKHVGDGWSALDNNDCTFHHCVIRNPDSNGLTALELTAGGGLVYMVDCFWDDNSILELSCQNASLVNCVGGPINCDGSGSYNNIVLTGGYLYSGENGYIIQGGVASGRISSVVALGTLFVVSVHTDNVFNGDFDLGASLIGCRIDKGGSYVGGNDTVVFGSDTGQFNANRVPVFRFDALTTTTYGTDNLDYDTNRPAAVKIDMRNCMFGTSADIEHRPECSFKAYLAATANNQTGDGTAYEINPDTEDHDHGANFNATNGNFVTPVAGVYHFEIAVHLDGITSDHSQTWILLSVGGANKLLAEFDADSVANGSGDLKLTGSATISVAAGVTIKPVVQVNGTTLVVDIVGGEFGTTFSGFLI